MSDKDNKIEIKLYDTEGLCFVFKIQKNQPIKLLMAEFCTRRNLDLASCRFCYDGERINPFDEHGNPNTPETLG